MSVLFRARLASFMSGVAVSGGFAFFQLKKDIVDSHELLVKQVRNIHPSILMSLFVKEKEQRTIQQIPLTVTTISPI